MLKNLSLLCQAVVCPLGWLGVQWKPLSQGENIFLEAHQLPCLRGALGAGLSSHTCKLSSQLVNLVHAPLGARNETVSEGGRRAEDSRRFPVYLLVLLVQFFRLVRELVFCLGQQPFTTGNIRLEERISGLC